ncbi:PPOX class probable F420-dependent enzyme [Kitasatospora gansuensis]|uniref:PPOX class probable F420-dependent enzyme n=1 Tax=Kitasatospora gansuensis TaxID=258050 RepID=A0A7W7SF92_9ACTN|nr:PPOX class F420-dependent oxidoreductase [Kitasatospora gansuensis]MBB4949375.1 PPOX class probable F420-dependent enzyme [Kitasatospora gansuensis]
MSTPTLGPEVRALLDARNFATVTTLNPDGGPQSSVMWLKREGDTVLLSTTAGRQKARNLARDPRISVSVYDLANPYSSVELRGTAELLPDPDRQLPYELSHRYLGTDPPLAEPDEVRLIIRVTPAKVLRFAV